MRLETYLQFVGTGSGSFSHSVIRTVGSSGHLWSYEFHEARAAKARSASSSSALPLINISLREEFARHGFLDTVTLTHRNVCKDGFTVIDEADSRMFQTQFG